jgi:hypothetical protein
VLKNSIFTDCSKRSSRLPLEAPEKVGPSLLRRLLFGSAKLTEPTDCEAPETGYRPEGVGLSIALHAKKSLGETYIEVRRNDERLGQQSKWAFFSNLLIYSRQVLNPPFDPPLPKAVFTNKTMTSKSAPFNIKYHPLEKITLPRPVDRINYIKKQSVGLKVLDLGAYDETLIGEKQHSSWRWLHSEIAEVAQEVLGVDSSPEIKAQGRLKTPCGTTIHYGTVDALEEIVSVFNPDLIVAGELVEHTPNTLEWIIRLSLLSPGTRFIATTPNATSIINLLMSFLGRENCHEDHLHIYSYKTLATLARKAGMETLQIIPYYYDPHIFVGRFPNWLAPLIYSFNYFFTTPVQYLFPLTAFGLILDGSLNRASQ